MTMKHLILGGARSGKSRYAEQCAQSLFAGGERELTYIATATAGDSEMFDRIEQHKLRRSQHWHLVEEPIALASAVRATSPAAIILIDCLTLWLSNCMHKQCWSKQRDAFLETLINTEHTLIMVSNEVGSGIVPMGALSREFADQSGWLHQDIAEHCSKVDLVVAGLPLALKNTVS